MFKTETETFGQEVFEILQRLFRRADGYVADPELRKESLASSPELWKYSQGLDDEELRDAAREAAPPSRLVDVQNRWLQAGLQIATVAVFDTYMSDIPLTVSVGLPASENARKYKSLISQFIKGQISAAEFQTTYLQAFKTSEDMLGQDEFDILEYLFTSADGYVADPESRRELLAERPDLRKYGQGLDDEELRADAREAYRQLFGE